MPPDGDLDGYALMLVPTLSTVPAVAPARLAAPAAAGATVLVAYFSGLVDGMLSLVPGAVAVVREA